MNYKLKAKRVEKGIKQRDMARILGVTPQHLCKIEKGTAKPRLDMIKKLSEILETPMQELFF